MKKFKLLSIITAGILLLSGCSINSMDSDDSSLPAEDGATEITIEVRDYSPDFYANAAKKFEEETGVKVNVINDYHEDQGIEDTMTNNDRITSELMAGKGADLYVGFYFDFNTIGENKHLCNMADWIAEDPDFTNEEYYMNIIQSQITGDDMYAFPLFILCKTLGSSVEIPELDGQNLSWEEFFEQTTGIERNGVLYGLTDCDIFQRRFRERSEGFISEKNKTQKLNSPEMISLLEQCKEWSEQNLCVEFDEGYQEEIFDNALFKEYLSDIVGLANIQTDPNVYFYDIPSDLSGNNKANKISPTDLVCVNAASRYKNTVWKFIKFLLSEEIQKSSIYTPVNRKAAEKNINDFLHGIVESYKLTIDVDKAIKDTSDTLSSIGKIYNMFPTPLEQIVFAEAERYFKNEISAEEAAKTMADKVELYFKEQ